MSLSLLLQADAGLQGFPKLAGDASIFFIVGGLCMLGLVVVLVLLRTIFPTGKPGAGGLIEGRLPRFLLETSSLAKPVPRTRVPLEPTSNRFEEGHRTGAQLAAKGPDEILDHVDHSGWGEPRLLRFREDEVLVRYYKCDECDARARAPTAEAVGCTFQAGFLGGAFGRLGAAEAQVRELSCRAQGSPVCDFEVRLA
jgi:hypothetical protein